MLQGLRSRDPPHWRQLEQLVKEVDAIRGYFVSHEGIKLLEPFLEQLLAGDGRLMLAHDIVGGLHFLELLFGGLPDEVNDDLGEALGVPYIKHVYFLVQVLEDELEEYDAG